MLTVKYVSQGVSSVPTNRIIFLLASKFVALHCEIDRANKFPCYFIIRSLPVAVNGLLGNLHALVSSLGHPTQTYSKLASTFQELNDISVLESK